MLSANKSPSTLFSREMKAGEEDAMKDSETSICS